MNTLGKEITRSFYMSENGFNELQERWAILFQDKAEREKLTSIHFLVYAILRGKDYRKCYTSSVYTMRCDVHRLKGLHDALSRIGNQPSDYVKAAILRSQEQILAPFIGIVTPDVLDRFVPYLMDQPCSEADAYRSKV